MKSENKRCNQMTAKLQRSFSPHYIELRVKLKITNKVM